GPSSSDCHCSSQPSCSTEGASSNASLLFGQQECRKGPRLARPELTRLSTAAVLRREPDGSADGGKHNCHLVSLLSPGTRRTVARLQLQHQPSSRALGPKLERMFPTAVTPLTAAERMNSHWSAPGPSGSRCGRLGPKSSSLCTPRTSSARPSDVHSRPAGRCEGRIVRSRRPESASTRWTSPRPSTYASTCVRGRQAGATGATPRA